VGDGELRADLRVIGHGSSVISTQTLFAGDPGGPPSLTWQLTLSIEG
jgi:hypothetical protein